MDYDIHTGLKSDKEGVDTMQAVNIKNFAKRIRNRFEFFFCHNRFVKKGKSNTIVFGKDTRFRYCNVIIHGNDNKIVFESNCSMIGLNILIEEDHNIIEFGDHVKINGSRIQPTVVNAVGGRKITIGSGCLLSNNIEIHTSDYHGIYNTDGILINPDKDITIGKNVWIGLGCKILKGSVISDGTVVGAGSLLSGVFPEKNVIIAGNPAKIIKHQIFWKDQKSGTCPVPDELMALPES